jgi:hypothetical protein
LSEQPYITRPLCSSLSLELRSKFYLNLLLPILLAYPHLQDEFFDEFGMRYELQSSIDDMVIFIRKQAYQSSANFSMPL